MSNQIPPSMPTNPPPGGIPPAQPGQPVGPPTGAPMGGPAGTMGQPNGTPMGTQMVPPAGTPMAGPPTGQPPGGIPPTQPGYLPPNQPNPPAKKKTKKALLIGIPVALVVVAALVIGGIFAFGKFGGYGGAKNPETLSADLLKALTTGDLATPISMSAPSETEMLSTQIEHLNKVLGTDYGKEGKSGLGDLLGALEFKITDKGTKTESLADSLARTNLKVTVSVKVKDNAAFKTAVKKNFEGNGLAAPPDSELDSMIKSINSGEGQPTKEPLTVPIMQVKEGGKWYVSYVLTVAELATQMSAKMDAALAGDMGDEGAPGDEGDGTTDEEGNYNPEDNDAGVPGDEPLGDKIEPDYKAAWDKDVKTEDDIKAAAGSMANKLGAYAGGAPEGADFYKYLTLPERRLMMIYFPHVPRETAHLEEIPKFKVDFTKATETKTDYGTVLSLEGVTGTATSAGSNYKNTDNFTVTGGCLKIHSIHEADWADKPLTKDDEVCFTEYFKDIKKLGVMGVEENGWKFSAVSSVINDLAAIDTDKWAAKADASTKEIVEKRLMLKGKLKDIVLAISAIGDDFDSE